jgi:hypothetical protein
MTALLILAACDQAQRAVGSAVGPRKAIAELKYAGDRPDGKSVAISNRRGVAVWDTATDAIRFPLKDSKRKPLPYPMQR